jgi:MoaA/NifB/PqqE/SkfB family radical SAM enzyme
MNLTKKANFSNLSDIFIQKAHNDSHIGKRLLGLMDDNQRVEAPRFPRQIQVETTNICNHRCEFCAYTVMQRPKKHIKPELFYRIVEECYDLGAREIGLFAGAEPLTCKVLDQYIMHCKKIGYEYIYISTNGALGDERKFEKIIEAGLSSIKFSINGGDRETYKSVHGRDDFDRVIANVRFVNSYRKQNKIDLWLGVSFVGTPQTDETFQSLKDLLEAVVDEIIYYEASNQSGQMTNLPDPPYRDCHLPFNKAHFSLEGYIKACCNDYENLLALEDINEQSISSAWHSDRFRKLREKHLSDRLEGTLCGNCIRACETRPRPLNDKLSTDLDNT